MQKTRFGIAVGLLGAVMYLVGLYGGYIITLLLAGYILVFEENEWLKKSAVKSVVLMIVFSVLSTVVYFIPNVISLISSIFGIFGGYFHIEVISDLAEAVSNALGIMKQLLFIGLGLKALNQGNITVPAVDKLIEKYMG